MPDRFLLAIPLAHGRSGNTGFLSVYFSPRLVENGPLSDYPDWEDWPGALTNMNIDVRINNTVRGHNIVSAAPSSAKWLSIFPGTTPVKKWRSIDRSVTQFKTYDEVALTTSVEDMYAGVAVTDPDDPPTMGGLLSDPSTNTLLTGGPSASPLPDAQAYLDPFGSAALEGPEVDFHNALVMLGAHPELLRMLGIVVDFEVSLGNLTPSTVEIETNWANQGGTDIKKQVRIRMRTTSGFWMKPNDSNGNLFKEQINGWLELGDGDWALTQTDSLAATQQLSGVVSGVGQAGASGALPAAEEGGLSLMRVDHATALHNQYVRNAQIDTAINTYIANNTPPVVLYAEDVTQGERIDIKDNISKEFLSVFQRKTDANGYVFPRTPAENVVPAKDEGWNTFVLTSDVKETYDLVDPAGLEEGFDIWEPNALQRIRDTIFTWNGWSSVGPPPGSVLDAEGNVVDPPPNTVSSSDDVQFQATYRVVKGTLPRLRYGRTYTMRARPVDLSGVSRELSETHPAAAESPDCLFGRSPVPSPTIVRFAEKDPLPGVGEFVATVVLRSDYNTQLSNIASQARILLPSRASQTRLELHAQLNGGIKIADYDTLVERDALSAEGECTIDPNSNDLLYISPTNAVSSPVDYFPDPAGAGAAFAGLPLTNNAQVVTWEGTWPDLRGMKLVVKATGNGPKLIKSGKGNTLEVTVPKAFDEIIDVSSAIAANKVDKFKVYGLLKASDQTALKDMILDGQHWMLSARGALRLVHAVRRPMTKPLITLLEAERPTAGGLEADITGTLDVHLASTDRTVLSATWTDPVDRLTDPEPEEVPGAITLGSVVGNAVNLTPQFHDTKRHDLVVTGEAFSKFASYFTEDKLITFTADEMTMDNRGVIESSVIVSDPGTGDVFVKGTDYTLDALAGKITRESAGDIAPGEQVNARFIRLPTSRLTTEDSPDDTYAFTVPASSPPIPLTVREVIPAFSFAQTNTQAAKTRTRSGAVLRIWTERGWYTSGRGELLGVLVDSNLAGVPDTTRFARDPVVEEDGSVKPKLSNFPRAVSERTQVAAGLNVSGHEPVFDATRGLWSSDIEVDGAIGYRPFVRLSIARWQPIARDDALLSEIVDLDPIRMGPIRTAKVTVANDGDIVVTLTGREHDGVPDETNSGALLFNTVKVSFQRAAAGVTDPDLKWTTQRGPFTATRSLLANGQTRWRLQRAVNLAAPYRVLIEESEPSMRSDGAGNPQVAREVVYVETIELDQAFIDQ